MTKEKFHIPMPDERTIQQQVSQIVAVGTGHQPSFYLYMKTMVQQVGLQHLLSGHSILALISMMAIGVVGPFVIGAESTVTNVDDLYAQLFLLSPLLFIAFSIYTYAIKISNVTYEVEMSCKYNVYQMIAFRMLIFSVVAILVNTASISLIIIVYENIHFMRAFMISTTGLFVFSIFFLYTMMKRRSLFSVAATVIVWITVNLVLKYADDSFYSEVLVGMPLFVYALVLMVSFYYYIRALKRLICIKQMEGAY
ncbi:hypothetical protein DV702_15220 [Sporosarcina sp. PTS2304]|uniref:hypothetical protein n=1 Tax=Sporosarcina sp. PTS2304 TaxID=2283194 RepID=UPI000E0DE372|nr:hypothetical protein [Sporosarcina sp. PTS2304]AXI00941.1 hypothetical protein DV702_15220 [Sporosarcina sp. PTS2304]